MVLDLQKGMSLDLSKTNNGLSNIAVGVNWGKIVSKSGLFGMFGKTEEDVDLDVSAILYDEDGKYVNKVYFGNLQSNGVKHSGDDLSGDSSKDANDNETITFSLDRLHPHVAKVAIVLVSFRGQDFSKLPYAEMKMYDISKGKQIVSKTELALEGKYKGSTAMTFGIINRVNGNWEFKAICEPTKGSLDFMINEAKKYF